MDPSLETHSLPGLSHEKLQNLNTPIHSREMEIVTQNLPKSKRLGPEGFATEFHQTLTEEEMPVLLNLFQNLEEQAILPNSFYL